MEKEKKDRLILYFRKLFALFLYCFVLCSIIPPVPSETGDDVTTTVASIIAAIVCIIANVIGNYKKTDGYGIIIITSLLQILSRKKI